MRKKMKIKSRIENLRLVEKFIDEISSELSLSDEIYGNVMIATLEAANNAIVHGNKENDDLEVEISLSKEEDELFMTIKDQGKGFDYRHIPDPTSPENLEKINGRGVFLMEKLSDGIEFSENGSVVKLSFNTNV
jgi:serine/threonine-protein kinase RsbW